MFKKFCILLVFSVFTLLIAEFPITLYHAHENFNFSEALFAEHLDFLKDNDYHTVTLDDFMDWRLHNAPMPLRPIVLTFDDNYLGMRYIAYPLLKERDYSAVNFAHMIAINRPDNGDFRADWPELIQWENEGVLYTESHSWNHLYLTTLTDSDAWFEINDSRLEIEANMPGKTAKYLAYPYGNYDARIVDKSQRAGYEAALTTINQRNRRDTPLYELHRVSTDGKSLEEFKNLIGFYTLPPGPPGEGWTFDVEGVHFSSDSAFISSSSEENGTYYSSVPTPQSSNSVIRLAFDSTGRLYLGDYSGKVWYTDTPFASNPGYQLLLDMSLVNGIQGIAIDQYDNVYLSGDDNPDGVIYSFSPVGSLRWSAPTGRITGCSILSTGELLVTDFGGKFFLYNSANGNYLGEHQVSGLGNYVRDISAAPDDAVFAIQSGLVNKVTGGNALNLSGYSAASFGSAPYSNSDWNVRPSILYYDQKIISSNFLNPTGSSNPRVFIQDAVSGSLLQVIDDFPSEDFSPSGVAVIHDNGEDYLFVTGLSSQIRIYTMNGAPPGSSGYFGNGFLYSEPGDGSEQAGWSLFLPETRSYRLYAWWSESSQWATDTPIDIYHYNGIHSVYVNQQQDGSQWNELGTYTFSNDTAARILVNNNADGPVVIDGLWIEPVDVTAISDWYLYF